MKNLQTMHLRVFCALVWPPDLSLGMGRVSAAAPDGNSNSSSWCLEARSTARCCNFSVRRPMVNSTSNFILQTKRCSRLTQGWSGSVYLPAKKAIQDWTKSQSLPYLLSKPSFTLSSSTLCTYPLYTVIGLLLSSDIDTFMQSPRSTDGRFSDNPGTWRQTLQ